MFLRCCFRPTLPTPIPHMRDTSGFVPQQLHLQPPSNRTQRSFADRQCSHQHRPEVPRQRLLRLFIDNPKQQHSTKRGPTLEWLGLWHQKITGELSAFANKPAPRPGILNPRCDPENLALSFIDGPSRLNSRPKLSAPIQLPRPLNGNSPPQRNHFINCHIRPRPYLLRPAGPSAWRCTSEPTGYRRYQRRAIPYDTCRSQLHTRLAAREHQPSRSQTPYPLIGFRTVAPKSYSHRMRGGVSFEHGMTFPNSQDVADNDWTHPGGQTSWRKNNTAQQEQLPPLSTP